MICQCRIFNYSKYITLVGNVDNGGSDACAGAEDIWTSLCLPTQFYWELKAALKNKVY